MTTTYTDSEVRIQTVHIFQCRKLYKVEQLWTLFDTYCHLINWRGGPHCDSYFLNNFFWNFIFLQTHVMPSWNKADVVLQKIIMKSCQWIVYRTSLHNSLQYPLIQSSKIIPFISSTCCRHQLCVMCAYNRFTRTRDNVFKRLHHENIWRRHNSKASLGFKRIHV